MKFSKFVLTSDMVLEPESLMSVMGGIKIEEEEFCIRKPRPFPKPEVPPTHPCDVA